MIEGYFKFFRALKFNQELPFVRIAAVGSNTAHIVRNSFSKALELMFVIIQTMVSNSCRSEIQALSSHRIDVRKDPNNGFELMSL